MKHDLNRYYIGSINKIFDISFMMGYGAKIKRISHIKNAGIDIFYKIDENIFYGIKSKRIYFPRKSKIGKKIVIQDKLIPIQKIFDHLNIESPDKISPTKLVKTLKINFNKNDNI